MLPQSLSAAQGKTLEAPVHQSSPRNALPAVSPRQNLSQIGGRHLSPHQSPGSGIFCRICHEGDFIETLLSPCSCSGSVGVVHRSCLERWLSSSQYDTCELCRQPLTVTRTYRSILQWLCRGESSGDDQRNLVGDSVCLMLLTPLATVSAYLCSSGASYYAKQGQVAEAAGLVGLCLVLCLVYLLWLLLTARYHCQVILVYWMGCCDFMKYFPLRSGSNGEMKIKRSGCWDPTLVRKRGQREKDLQLLLQLQAGKELSRLKNLRPV